MNVLVINCGSSSLKFQIIEVDSGEVLCKGLCERIGIDGSFTYEADKCGKIQESFPMPTHSEAIKRVIDATTDPKTGVIKSLDEIDAVGHRIAHGGENYTTSGLVTEEMIKAIEDCTIFAPLHNPANVIGIRACQELMKDTPMVCVFDTAFHQTIPEKAFMYAIPYEYYEKYKIRRYGFHGTSHAYVSKKVCEVTGRDFNNTKVIVCHLGNGASVTAIENGKSVDTSMGLTPLEGLMMGTRSGNIDPGAIELIAKIENVSVSDVLSILNKKSGVEGISGVSSDFRDLEKAEFEDNNERAKLAVDMFVYRVAKYIGSYAAAMNGVDVIVFTAGIGENDSYVRSQVMSYLGYLGVTEDPVNNKKREDAPVLISTEDSKVKVYTVPTNEELAIAQETAQIVRK